MVSRGDVVIVEKRGVPVVEMRVAGPFRNSGFPEGHWEAMQRYPKFQNDSGALVSESRDRG